MQQETKAPGFVLAIDCGNTSTSFGLFAGDADAMAEPLGTFESTTPKRLSADEARMKTLQILSLLAQDAGIDAKAPFGTILSCVVPSLTESWREGLAKASGLKPLVVGPGLKSGMRLAYKDPSEIGPDRLADAVATRALLGSPAIAVDFGTTLNIEAIGQDGSFLGGIIAPGVALGARALRGAAARLPEIELAVPAHAIGTTTKEAMQSGLILGEIARVDGLLDAVMAELGTAAPIVVTGDGAASLAASMRHEAKVDEALTLKGLHLLYCANPKLQGRAGK